MARTNRSPKSTGGATVAEAPAVTVDDALTSKAVAPIDAHPVTAYVAPADFTGFEDQTSEDIRVPFLTALQDLSPQIKAGPKKVPGAVSGMLFDSLTGEMFDGTAGVPIIPVMRIREEQEWNPRNKGGGLVARHDPNAPAIKRQRKAHPFGKIETAEGTEISQVVKLYVRYQHPTTGQWRPAIVVFASSNTSEYQRFYTLASALRFNVLNVDGTPVLTEAGHPQQAQYPMFAHRWRLRTVFHTKGNDTWYKLKLDVDGASFEDVRLPQTDREYQEAHALAKMIRDGRVIEDEPAGDTNPNDEVPEL